MNRVRHAHQQAYHAPAIWVHHGVWLQQLPVAVALHVIAARGLTAGSLWEQGRLTLLARPPSAARPGSSQSRLRICKPSLLAKARRLRCASLPADGYSMDGSPANGVPGDSSAKTCAPQLHLELYGLGAHFCCRSHAAAVEPEQCKGTPCRLARAGARLVLTRARATAPAPLQQAMQPSGEHGGVPVMSAGVECRGRHRILALACLCAALYIQLCHEHAACSDVQPMKNCMCKHINPAWGSQK